MKQKITSVVLVLVTILTLFTSCDTGGEDDGTVANWFMAILCLLAWMKGGRR